MALKPFAAIPLVVLVAGSVGNATADERALLERPEILDCDAVHRPIEMDQEAKITIYTGLYSGIAFEVKLQKFEAAYFDFQDWTPENKWKYVLTGHTTQYSCGILCPKPSPPDVAALSRWYDATLAAALQGDAQGIPAPPVCR